MLSPASDAVFMLYRVSLGHYALAFPHPRYV